MLSLCVCVCACLRAPICVCLGTGAAVLTNCMVKFRPNRIRHCGISCILELVKGKKNEMPSKTTTPTSLKKEEKKITKLSLNKHN